MYIAEIQNGIDSIRQEHINVLNLKDAIKYAKVTIGILINTDMNTMPSYLRIVRIFTVLRPNKITIVRKTNSSYSDNNGFEIHTYNIPILK
jgi:hypothetical protein